MVTLRAKKLSSGKFHLFIDAYKDGQRIKEYLKLYISEDYTQPQTDKHGNVLFDAKGQPKISKPKSQDREIWDLAQNIRLKRELALKSNEYGFTPAFKANASFTEYFTKNVDKYNRKDLRKAKGSLAKFNEFNKQKNISCISINEEYVISFKEFLEEKLSSETAASYFRQFKSTVKKAHKEGLLKTNYAEDVRIKTTPGLQKDILDFTEIQKLHNTPAGNNEVKRAFLFSCMTGLRFCDIVVLKWNDVKDNGEGLMVSLIQSKTSKPLKVNLNKDAIKLLGKRMDKEMLVFTLPTHTSVLKTLKNWTKKAEVNKNVTYHVARHSFATNLIFYGADVKTASTLLGHTNLDFTNLYVREVESLKQKAVHQLPELSEA